MILCGGNENGAARSAGEGEAGGSGAREDGALYLVAVDRYGRDEGFRVRVERVRELVVAAEHGGPTGAARTGLWIGAAVALHMTDVGAA